MTQVCISEILKGLGIARGLATPETFPLPRELSERLKSVTDVVYNGRGFKVFRGLDPAKYSEEEAVVMYAGLTSHVASKRGRNIGTVNPLLKPSLRQDKAIFDS